MPAARIAEISVYPVKSAAGLRLDACPLETRGLAGDRRWMVVSPEGGSSPGASTRASCWSAPGSGMRLSFSTRPAARPSPSPGPGRPPPAAGRGRR